MEKYSGLNSTEVSMRLNRDGYNELPTQKSKNIFHIMFKLVSEPMILLLLLSGLLYLLLGEPKDATVMMISVVGVILLTYYQERKTEKALQALRDLSSPRAIVIRENNKSRIPGREVVIDDVIVLQEGDRVPADAIVLESQNLQIDESLLTGESLPVNKTEGSENSSSYIYSGTLIVQGSGIAKVSAIGLKTEMGKIGKTLSSIEHQDSLLKREIKKIVKLFLLIGVTLCTVLVVVQVVSGFSLLSAFMAGLTLSMSMLPEEFPVVLMIFLSLGAWRISKKQVLSRNNQAIETLGATSVLCVDKTGTLTLNKMELKSLVTSQELTDISQENMTLSPLNRELLEFAKLACKRNAFDPLEKEVNSKFENLLPDVADNHKDWHLQKHYNLSKDLFALSRVWKSPGFANFIVASKGAPEAILSLCNMSKEQQDGIMEIVKEMSGTGQKVLGVAKAEFTGSQFPETQGEFNFNFVGLLGFVDPIRDTVADSVKECYKAGIRVIMITGDYPGTACYIAKQAGIQNADYYVTGSELENISERELEEKITNINIFCRVVPEQKLKIVNALKKKDYVVAMTGDGVNDGPALKTAHIGIAMGERGTDVARESSDLVLLNDDFTSIVTAVKLGRRIYDNLQKAVSYIFSAHIPIAGIALLPAFFGLPMVLFPVHIAFLELIIDPACSTVYESEESEKGIMDRPPRNIMQRLFDKQQVLISTFQGFVLLISVMLIYIMTNKMGLSEDTSRTVAFLTMVFSNLALIFANLSKSSALQKYETHKNKAFYVILGGTVASMGLVLYVPFLRDLFHFSLLNIKEITIVLCMTVISFLWFEFSKVLRAKVPVFAR